MPGSLLVGAAVVGVLVLGAAANGFERSLDHEVPAGEPPRAPARVVAPRGGPPLPASVVAHFFDRSDDSAAAVVRVVNTDAHRRSIDGPITVELLDASRKVVATNAGAGPMYTHVPYLPPGRATLFVSDALQAVARPTGGRALAAAAYSVERRSRVGLRAGPPRLSSFGWVIDVAVADRRRFRSQDVYAQAVVQKAGGIVAAGAQVVSLRAHAGSESFQIFLHGDPRGGITSVWAWAAR